MQTVGLLRGLYTEAEAEAARQYRPLLCGNHAALQNGQDATQPDPGPNRPFAMADARGSGRHSQNERPKPLATQRTRRARNEEAPEARPQA